MINKKTSIDWNWHVTTILHTKVSSRVVSIPRSLSTWCSRCSSEQREVLATQAHDHLQSWSQESHLLLTPSVVEPPPHGAPVQSPLRWECWEWPAQLPWPAAHVRRRVSSVVKSSEGAQRFLGIKTMIIGLILVSSNLFNRTGGQA